MVPLIELLGEGGILVDPPAKDKASLIRLMVAALPTDAVSDTELLIRDILAREELISTGLGLACAVPHAASAGADRTCLSMARLAKAIDFGASDGLKARIVFLMAGPPDAVGHHLKLISKVARFLHDDAFREGVLSAPDAAAIAALIREKEA